MSLASIIGGFRRRIQALERDVGKLGRRLGEELPPEWEAKKLSVNPLNLNYTPIVPLQFGSSTCRRMAMIDGRLQADMDGGLYAYTLCDSLATRFTPFPGAKGWGIPYSPEGAAGFLVLWHQGMGMPVWLTGLAGLVVPASSHVSGSWWAFKWNTGDGGEGWDPPLTWQSAGCAAAMLLNSATLSEDVYYSLITEEEDWEDGHWMLVQMFHTAAGFFFDTHVAPTFGTMCQSGQIPGFDWYAVKAK